LRSLYTLVLYLLLPLVLLRLAWRGLRLPDYRRRWAERFGFVKPAAGEPLVWIHAVSVGEVRTSAPLVVALRKRFPQCSLLMTTVTPTGSAQITALFADAVAQAYAPYDLPGAVARFLGRVRPALAVVMETELWPNLFQACHRGGIPLLLLNARLSEKSLAGYRRFPGLSAQMLAAVTQIVVREEADRVRFRSLGAVDGKITVAGDLKFEQRPPPELPARGAALRRAWGEGRPVWVAGSTHAGEEEMLLDAFEQIRETIGDCLLVLVPRHPERFVAVAALCRSRGYRTRLHSAKQPCRDDTDVYLGDSMGELLVFYAAADVAFVGGSLVPVGGHNLLEPAALGIPVVTGPQVFKAAGICAALVRAGACRQAGDATGLADIVGHWLQDPAARRAAGTRGREFVEQHRGALQKVLAIVGEYLSQGKDDTRTMQ
jgi:3-deoxy-D-manno-octulosonic-acid transferase